MAFSPAILLVPYMLGLLLFAVLGSFAVYRLLKFGSPSAGSWLMVSTFGLGTALVIATSLWQLAKHDWSTPIVVEENLTDDPYAYPPLD